MAKGDRILSVVERSGNDEENKLSGGVVDGWLKNGLN
jgi:hypothetical protein